MVSEMGWLAVNNWKQAWCVPIMNRTILVDPCVKDPTDGLSISVWGILGWEICGGGNA